MTAVPATTSTQPVPAYQRIHDTYANKPSNYVSLAERVREALAQNNNNTNSLTWAVEEFNQKFPTIKAWKDLSLCEAREISMDKIVIDTTLQRDLDISWVCEILKTFNPTRADAIKVYRDANQPDHTVTGWDGQHTLVVLYVIAVMVLKLKPEHVLVPIVINPSTSKDEMRENFMAHNGDGKKTVSDAEKHRQMCLGVRVDNSSNMTWQLHEKIQQYLEANNMFVCDKHSQDKDQPGAISNMSEILHTVSGTFSLADYTNFCKYFHSMCNSNRAVDSTEQWQILYLMRALRQNQVLVDDAYIQAMTHTLNKVFTPSLYSGDKLLERAKCAYLDWFENNVSVINTLQGHSWHGDKRKQLHLEYLLALLHKHARNKFVVPKNSHTWVQDKYLTLDWCRA
jgi:hypothetical protein